MKKLAGVPIVFWIIVLAIVIIAGALGYLYWQTDKRFDLLVEDTARISSELATATSLLSDKTASIEQNLEEKTKGLSDTLSSTEKKIQQSIDSTKNDVGKISGAVGTLEKLAKTDPELLQKYSKVFFLNEHFTPERMVEIDSAYAYSEQRVERVHQSVWPYLKKMIDAAKGSGQTLYIKSAFRSFEEQKNTKTSYSTTYGAGTANTFSADQGYSEHQLGTTVDFITTGLGGALDGFGETEEYGWLVKNAHKYGFTLSYPEGNSYYIYEPWHWRFVGVELATYLYNNKKNFYDLDQRTIDEYLVKIFD